MQTKIVIALGVLVVLIGALLAFGGMKEHDAAPIDSTPQPMTISGTYECLPHANPDGPQTMECAFGIKSDQGDHYAVNFGQSADAMNAFQSGQHVTISGFFVPKEALNSDQWQRYNMKGIFTVTSPATTTATSTASMKIDINAVCRGALAYMTFPDGASADKFVAECKEGKHPEVIERYKAQMNVGDGAQI